MTNFDLFCLLLAAFNIIAGGLAWVWSGSKFNLVMIATGLLLLVFTLATLDNPVSFCS